MAGSLKKDIQNINIGYSSNKKLLEQEEKLRLEFEKKFHKQKIQFNKEELSQYEKALQKIVNKYGDNLKSKTQEALKEYGKQVLTSTKQMVQGIMSSVNSGVDKYLGAYSQYFSNIQTRLLGTGSSYNNMLAAIKDYTSGSRAVSTLKVLEKLDKLISEGISYNVEQRAFLDVVKDKIAVTFEATNATLLQLIRINRQDTTAAYLGLETKLTQFLNQNFLDTSYLTSNLSKQVSAALYEATSQMGAIQGPEFEYNVQKWLGSFYASGMNPQTIQSIAQALSYLGSGNISGLLGNQQLTTLITMATERSGLNLGSILSGGLTPDIANQLLGGIYQQGVTANRGDIVSRSQYASLLGMSLSDLTALSNLTSKNITAVTGSLGTYQNLVGTTQYQLGQISSRTSVKEQLDNLISNFMSDIGENISSNAGLYTTYQIADLLGNMSIPIPFIGNVPIGQVMKLGIIGTSMLSGIGTGGVGTSFVSSGDITNLTGGTSNTGTSNTEPTIVQSSIQSGDTLTKIEDKLTVALFADEQPILSKIFDLMSSTGIVISSLPTISWPGGND